MTPEQIQKEREAAGISQAELARRLGVSAVAVHRWEKGTRTPSQTTLERLQEALASTAREGVRGPQLLVLLSGGDALALGPRGPVSVEVVSLDEHPMQLSDSAAKALTRAAARHPEVGAFLAEALARGAHSAPKEPLG